MNAQSQLALLILGTSLLRLAFAAATGLGIDESYMVSAGRVLGLGYFDHPPASWWLSWGAAHLLGTEASIAVRLPFVALFALSTWLMARLTNAVAGEPAGLWAAVLLNLSPVFGVTTGTWVLPDGPLDCALLGAALCLVHALSAQDRMAWQWWCGAGLCAGLALFSKYSAGLTIVGALAFLATSHAYRPWLRRPQPYAAGLVALAVFAPVLLWNATHGWASFAFQGDRAVGLRFHPLGPIATLAGEALFVLPWFWVPMMALLVAALLGRTGLSKRRSGETAGRWNRAWGAPLASPPPPALLPQGKGESVVGPARDPRGNSPGTPFPRPSADLVDAAACPALLAWLAVPPIVVFALVSAWSSQRVLFHWAAPGYLMLFPLLGQWAAVQADRAWLRRTVIGTAALVVSTVAVIGTQTRFDWLGASLAAVTRKDPTIEGIDWVSLHSDLAARGLLPAGVVVGVPNWRDAGKIAYALGPKAIVLCLNRDARQFGFAHPPEAFIGRDVLLLIPEPAEPSVARLARHFERIEPLPPAAVRLGGRVLEPVAVYQAWHLLSGP